MNIVSPFRSECVRVSMCTFVRVCASASVCDNSRTNQDLAPKVMSAVEIRCKIEESNVNFNNDGR